jgi:hypothetical protein
MKGYIVLDDFYKNPDLIREDALRSEFTKVHPKYPGIDSNTALDHAEAHQRIRSLIQKETVNAPYSGFFRLLTQTEHYTEGHGIHIDKYDIAVIVYLAHPGDHRKVGTRLVRHRESGLSSFYRIKTDPALNPAWRSLDNQEIMKRIVADMERNDASLWETIDEIEFKYNRAVIMRGNIFHKLSNGFGQGLKDGRLTQNFFLNLKRNAQPAGRV